MAEFNPFDKEGDVLDLSGIPPLGKFTVRGLKPGLLRKMDAFQAEMDEANTDAGSVEGSTEAVRAVCKFIEACLVGGDSANVAKVLTDAWLDDANESVTFSALMAAQAHVQAALGIEEVEAPNG